MRTSVEVTRFLFSSSSIGRAFFTSSSSNAKASSTSSAKDKLVEQEELEVLEFSLRRSFEVREEVIEEDSGDAGTSEAGFFFFFLPWSAASFVRSWISERVRPLVSGRKRKTMRLARRQMRPWRMKVRLRPMDEDRAGKILRFTKPEQSLQSET